jgi:hypothetical protein
LDGLQLPAIELCGGFPVYHWLYCTNPPPY